MQKVLLGNVITNLRGNWDKEIEDYAYLDAVYYDGSLYFGREKYIPKGAVPSRNEAWMLGVKGQDSTSQNQKEESFFIVNETDALDADNFYETSYKGYLTGKNLSNFPINNTPLWFSVSITSDKTHVVQTAWEGTSPNDTYVRTGVVTFSAKHTSDAVSWGAWQSTFTQADFAILAKDFRQKHQLTEDMSFYVNTNTGSDENKGDTPETAFKTIQYAVNTIAANNDLATFTCTLHVGAGSYEENIVLPSYPKTSGHMVIQGDSKDTVLILTDSFATDVDAGTWKIRNVHIRFKDINKLTTGDVTMVTTQGRSETFWDQCRFSCIDAPATATRDQIMFSVENGGRAVLQTGVEFLPSATAKVLCVMYAYNGTIEHQGGDSYTLISGALKPNGTNTIGYCIKLSRYGLFTYTHPAGTTKPYFTGTLTNAYRYLIELASICNTAGQGAAAFPGSANGSVATAGQFI